MSASLLAMKIVAACGIYGLCDVIRTWLGC